MGFLGCMYRSVLLPLVIVTLLAMAPAKASAGQGKGKPVEEPDEPGIFVPIPPERADHVKMLQAGFDRVATKLKMRLGELTEALEQQYSSYHLDEKLCRRLQQEIRITQDQLLEMHHNFQIKLRGLLTETEFEMLQQKFRKAREQKSKFWRFRLKPGAEPDWPKEK
jgi:hypothetical protein